MRLTPFLLIGIMAAALTACDDKKKPTAERDTDTKKIMEDLQKKTDAAVEKMKAAAKDVGDAAKPATDKLVEKTKEAAGKAEEVGKQATHEAAKAVEDAAKKLKEATAPPAAPIPTPPPADKQN